MSALALALVALRKEVVDALRDRRAVTMALLFPLLGPVVLSATLVLLARNAGGEGALELPFAGREHAPELARFLEGAGVTLLPAPDDPAAAVRAGDRDLVVVVPPEFAERLRAGRPAPVQLVHDPSRQSSHAPVARARRLLEAWGRQIGVQRLLARGVHPALADAVAVEEVDLATPESRAALLLGVLPYFVVLALFIGGTYIAIDTTAGERERQSLEPLLVHPVPRWCFALAKIAATALFASAALLETLLGFALIPAVVPAERFGFTVRLEPGVLLRLLAVALPLLLFVSCLQIVVAARARGFKAAQASLSLLMMVPVLPGMMLAFLPVKLAPWMAAVPTLGEQLVMGRLLRGEPTPLPFALWSMAATSAWAALLAWLAVRLFEGEKLVFGK